MNATYTALELSVEGFKSALDNHEMSKKCIAQVQSNEHSMKCVYAFLSLNNMDDLKDRLFTYWFEYLELLTDFYNEENILEMLTDQPSKDFVSSEFAKMRENESYEPTLSKIHFGDVGGLLDDLMKDLKPN